MREQLMPRMAGSESIEQFSPSQLFLKIIGKMICGGTRWRSSAGALARCNKWRHYIIDDIMLER